MKVQDVMTSPAHSCSPEVSLAAAARTMSDYGCGALPVLGSGGHPIGILTDRDVCRAIAAGTRFAAAVRVREAMTLNPTTCEPAMPLGHALEIMGERKIRRLPVVDAQGRLVGIVSLADIVSGVQDTQWIASPLLRQLVAATRQSAALRPMHPVSDRATD